MPFALIVIGILLFITALNNTWRPFGQQLYSDLFGPNGGFVYWIAALVTVGLIGYIPSLKKPSDLFMVLIVIGLMLHNGGFFTQLQQGLQAGPSGSTGATGANTATGSSTALPNTGLFSGPLGGLLLQQQAALGAEPLTTPAPAPAGQSVPLGQGGIGSA
jgi:hypothetical protein